MLPACRWFPIQWRDRNRIDFTVYLPAVASLSTSPGRLVLAAAHKTGHSSTHTRIPSATHAHAQASTLDRRESTGSCTHTHSDTHTHTPCLPTPPHTHSTSSHNHKHPDTRCHLCFPIYPRTSLPPPHPHPLPAASTLRMAETRIPGGALKKDTQSFCVPRDSRLSAGGPKLPV